MEQEEYAKKGYGMDGFVAGTGAAIGAELDKFEAAAKRHEMKQEAARQKAMRKKTDIMFKEKNPNPYDSDEDAQYEKAAVKDLQYEEGEELEEKSYDSELEEEFFGKKDPELNGRLEKNKEKQQKFNPDEFEKLEDINNQLTQA